MLDFLKRLLGLSAKQEQAEAPAPYKVEVAPVYLEAAPVVKVEAPVAETKTAAPAMTAKKKAQPKAPAKAKDKAPAKAKATKKPKMTIAK